MRLGALVGAALLAGCAGQPRPAAASGAGANRPLLDELNRARAWFHARKTAPIWARRLTQDQEVPTLEGVVTARAGDFLCRGEAGEVWPQAAAKVEARYTATDIVDADGWRKFLPRADSEGVMAAQVPRVFQVQTAHGTLSGKAGDYLLKNCRDRDVPYPADVWVVDQRLFRATYRSVAP